MGNLSEVIKRLSFRAEVFFSGNMCGIHAIGDDSNQQAHLHLLKSGVLTLKSVEGHKIIIDRPSVIFLPHNTVHHIIANESDGAQLVCANIGFDSGVNSPLVNNLPKFINYPVDDGSTLSQTARWLFDEAFTQRLGRDPMIDRLCDVFLIQMLRRLLGSDDIQAQAQVTLRESVLQQGLFAGLAHPRLAKLMAVLHDHPEQAWTLESMAEMSAMSRSKFAALFKSTVGLPPNDYLTDLRIAKAQRLLQEGTSVSVVANLVGYEHGSALARAFRKKLEMSPKEWLAKRSTE